MSFSACTSVQILFDYVLQELNSLTSEDSPFVVRDLFKGYEWVRIENKKTLGSMFFNWAKKEGADIVLPVGKTLFGQQKYKKISK